MSRSPTSTRSGSWISITWRTDITVAPELRARTSLGLGELLEHAHLIESIDADSPAALAALYRVLYALTARVTGSDDELGLDDLGEDDDDWRDRRRAVIAAGRLDPARIAAYFDRYGDRFDLCDPQRPFLQDPRLAEQCEKTAGVNKLVLGRPAGNNHRWFGSAHTDAAPIPIGLSQAFQNLLAWHYFGPSGRCATRKVGPVSQANARSGPLRSTVSFHLIGASLFQTLIAGIPMPAEEADPVTDLCPWEWEELPDPAGVPVEVTGPMSLLTARSQHAILLIPDAAREKVVDAYITWAWRDIVASPKDPFLCWLTSKEGNPYARRAESSRGLWRDLDSLLGEQGTAGNGPQPEIFRSPAPIPGRFRVQALGFDQDGQAKDNQLLAAITPPVITSQVDVNAEMVRRIGDLRVAGEVAAANLARAAKTAWSLFVAEKPQDCAWSQQAAARYWPEAEDLFWQRLRQEDFDGAAKAFRAIAIGVYNEVTDEACGSVRGVKAVESARLELYGGRLKQRSKATAKTKERQ